MEKKFKMLKNHLEIVVTHKDTLNLPGDINLGDYDQVTNQRVLKKNVGKLKEFIGSQKDSIDKQLETLNKQLDDLGKVQMIDSEVVEACKKQIGKGTKTFKQKMLSLNIHIEKVQRYTQLTTQIDYLNKQLKQINKEYADLTRALK